MKTPRILASFHSELPEEQGGTAPARRWTGEIRVDRCFLWRLARCIERLDGAAQNLCAVAHRMDARRSWPPMSRPVDTVASRSNVDEMAAPIEPLRFSGALASGLRGK